MKRNILCVILALTMLFSVSCGSTAPAGNASADSSSSADASGSAAESGTSSGEASTGTTDTTDSTGTAANSPAVFEYLDYSIGLLETGYYEDIVALNFVTLPEKLTGIEIPVAAQTVDEEAVKAEVEAMLDQYADYEKIYDRAVADGDLVNIDYVGRIDGVAFDGGNTNGTGTVVTAGSDQYIDDFLTQIIGAKPGDTVMVKVTFPAVYENNPALAGKDAEFETVINYIQGAYIIPELTDADVEKYLKEGYGYTTVEEACADTREMLKYDQIRAYLLEWLEQQCVFGQVPVSIIDDQNEILRQEVNNTAYQYGLSLESYLSYCGFSSMQDIYDYYAAETEYTVSLYLMCQAVAETLGLEATKEATDDYFINFLGMPNYAVYEYYYGVGYVRQDVLVHMVVMYLMDNATMA